jgi:hypothetical protein
MRLFARLPVTVTNGNPLPHCHPIPSGFLLHNHTGGCLASYFLVRLSLYLDWRWSHADIYRAGRTFTSFRLVELRPHPGSPPLRFQQVIVLSDISEVQQKGLCC